MSKYKWKDNKSDNRHETNKSLLFSLVKSCALTFCIDFTVHSKCFNMIVHTKDDNIFGSQWN